MRKILFVLVLIIAIIVGFKIFWKEKPKADQFTKEEIKAFKRVVENEDALYYLVNVEQLGRYILKLNQSKGVIALTGEAVHYAPNEQLPVKVSILFTKKNKIYSKNINAGDYVKNSVDCTLDVGRFFGEGDYFYPANTPELVEKKIKKYDYGYLIKSNLRFTNLKLYFDDGKTTKDVIEDYAVYIEIIDEGKKVVSFNKNGIIGEYKSIEEALGDSKNSPIPLELVKSKGYSKVPIASKNSNKEIISVFKTENFLVKLIKQSSIFYRLEVWDKSNLTEKPNVIYKNGIFEEGLYKFEQNNKKVVLKDGVQMEIIDSLNPENVMYEMVQ